MVKSDCSLLSVCNDGSGKLPVYRGLVDAVQSIVGTGGLKGLYQVSTFTTYLTLSLVICLVVFVPHGAMQIIYLSFSLKD